MPWILDRCVSVWVYVCVCLGNIRKRNDNNMTGHANKETYPQHGNIEWVFAYCTQTHIHTHLCIYIHIYTTLQAPCNAKGYFCG